MCNLSMLCHLTAHFGIFRWWTIHTESTPDVACLKVVLDIKVQYVSEAGELGVYKLYTPLSCT